MSFEVMDGRDFSHLPVLTSQVSRICAAKIHDLEALHSDEECSLSVFMLLCGQGHLLTELPSEQTWAGKAPCGVRVLWSSPLRGRSAPTPFPTVTPG